MESKERPTHRFHPVATKRARKLRRESTFPERVLWGHLRSGRLNGWQFRRQHVMGPYIVDFVCLDARLVIEIDGLSHVGRHHADQARTLFMERLGFRVIRFTNDEVLQSIDAVLAAIVAAVG